MIRMLDNKTIMNLERLDTFFRHNSISVNIIIAAHIALIQKITTADRT